MKTLGQAEVQALRQVEYRGVVQQFARLGLRLDLLKHAHLDDVFPADDPAPFHMAALGLAVHYRVTLVWSARGYRCRANIKRASIHISSKARRRRGIVLHEIAHILAHRRWPGHERGHGEIFCRTLNRLLIECYEGTMPAPIAVPTTVRSPSRRDLASRQVHADRMLKRAEARLCLATTLRDKWRRRARLYTSLMRRQAEVRESASKSAAGELGERKEDPLVIRHHLVDGQQGSTG
jgi:hypothetical protein